MKKDQIFQKEENTYFSSEYTPIFYRLKCHEDKNKFQSLIENEPFILIFDEILIQIGELLKIRNPKQKFSNDSLNQAVIDHLGSTSNDDYGVWVFYPWSKRLVHLVDEPEFVEIRTSRNQYKISPAERSILSKKRIGVIGVSVGQSVALTLTMERSYGELRLADFDTIELSNLNRIRTGVHNLGQLKVISTAREIAEIDPFLKVSCFSSGISKDSIDSFFSEGGKLDILIEECDSVEIKIQSRLKAKELGIPVLMEASDRGTIDVERFDLEPDRPLLHGFLAHLNLNKIDRLTEEDKLSFLLPIVGLDTMSAKLKASYLEVGQTINTWPQLGSAVALGGAIVADVCRRIFLNEFTDSGRYFVDLEVILGDKTKCIITNEDRPTVKKVLKKDLMVDQVHKLNLKNSEGQIELPLDVLQQLIMAGTSAPSVGNSQPWKWLYLNKNLYLFYNNINAPTLPEYEKSGDFIGLGAATENLVLKAHSLNLEVVQFFNEGDRNTLIATFQFFNSGCIKDLIPESHPCDDLVDGIFTRHTNRKVAKKQGVDKLTLKYLEDVAASFPGANLKWVNKESDMLKLAELMAKGNRLCFLDPKEHRNLLKEARWSKEEVLSTKDGMGEDTAELSPMEYVAFQLCKDYEILKYLNKWDGGSGFETKPRMAIRSSSAIGLITMPGSSLKDFYNGGRVMERVWLAANNKNLALQPQSALLFLFERLKHDKSNSMKERMIQELVSLRKQFVDLFSLDQRLGEIFIFRLFIAERPESRSQRHSVDDVLYS
jgi:molybdopterin/thiamine biosynthesis adenylyltransferase